MLFSLTAKDMRMFMMKWYEKFPTYKSRALFLTGESYAGGLVVVTKVLIELFWNTFFKNGVLILFQKIYIKCCSHVK